jgi:hypothetical protein
MKLTIELVPKTCWYTNVRSNVSKSKWDKLRKKCYRLANHKCEVCGKPGRVECHEVWHYDDETKIQKLIGLIALCKNCHKTKHFGLAQINGEEEIVIHHLMKINEITKEEAIAYISKISKQWEDRSYYLWKLDISFLDQYDNNSNVQ